MSATNFTEGAAASLQPSDADEPGISPLDDALIALTGELRQTLAGLAGTPDEYAETTIGLFPYGHRAVLESYKLITTSLSRSARRSEEDGENPRLQVHLTDLGREVIESCASSQEETEDLVKRAEELHGRFSDSLETEPATEEAVMSEEATN